MARTPEQIIGKDNLTQLVLEGYAVVPIEPTQKMVEAAFYEYMDYERRGLNKPPWNARTMWATMLRVLQLPATPTR